MTSDLCNRIPQASLLVLLALSMGWADGAEAASTKRDMQWRARSQVGPRSAASAGLEIQRAATLPEGTQLLPNGDFELGQTVWTEFSQNGWDLILSTDDPVTPPPNPPHSGDWQAWLGGDFDEISYIEQQVTVPAGTSDLTYWEWIDSEDLCGFDFASVAVNGSTVEQYSLCEDDNTLGWVLRTVDISSYAGQTVTIRIRVDTDDTLNSNLFVDDVAFELFDGFFADGFESGDLSAWSSSFP